MLWNTLINLRAYTCRDPLFFRLTLLKKTNDSGNQRALPTRRIHHGVSCHNNSDNKREYNTFQCGQGNA